MNYSARVSPFLLERYHIGEVSSMEKTRVEQALAQDASLAETLAGLESADRDFHIRYPRERFLPSERTIPRRRRPLVWGLCAAALVAAVALPLFVFKNTGGTAPIDRIKGASDSKDAGELSVYLKGSSAGQELKLPDQSRVGAGNTVQLAYQAPSGRYGVIFSIDGRSVVTLHYPYAMEQSTRLDSGRLVPLDEAYTLDDAPDFEMFFLVTGDKPLEARDILNTARLLAPGILKNPQRALQQGADAFKNCDVQILTLNKE